MAALAIGLAAAMALVLAPAAILRILAARRVRSVADAPILPWAIVLGAPTPPERPPAMLEDRLLVAAELWRLGRARRLLVAGDDGRRRCDEVSVMRRHLERLGVPAGDLIVDGEGLTTQKSLHRAAEVHGIAGALVVTQAFHLPRAIFLARAFGIDAYGVPADRRPYLRAVNHALREFPACTLAVVRVATSWVARGGNRPR